MVCNAGVGPEADVDVPLEFQNISDDIWHKTMSVNANGVFFCVRAAGAQMIKQDPHDNGDRGWIINLASIYGLIANGGSRE